MTTRRSVGNKLWRGMALLALTMVCLSTWACGKKEQTPAPGEVIETGTAASADGLSIYFTAQGDGQPALVFVHGWSCDGSYWSDQLAHFAKKYRVVAVDLAGHGQSGLERQQWTMAAFAQDVKAVVEKLGLERIVLIGHSMGGPVAVETARLMPARVVGVIGIDTLQDMGLTMPPQQREAFVAPMRDNFSEAARNFVRQMFTEDADSNLVTRVAADMSSAPPEIAVPAFEEVLQHDLRPALQEVKVPIHCINNDFWPTNTEGNKALAASYELTVMSNSGHFPFLERPEEFNRLLEEVIRGFTGDPAQDAPAGRE